MASSSPNLFFCSNSLGTGVRETSYSLVPRLNCWSCWSKTCKNHQTHSICKPYDAIFYSMCNCLLLIRWSWIECSYHSAVLAENTVLFYFHFRNGWAGCLSFAWASIVPQLNTVLRYSTTSGYSAKPLATPTRFSSNPPANGDWGQHQQF